MFSGFFGQGPVTIRNAHAGDAEFAARMTVDAYRGEYEWAAGKRK